MCGIDLAVAFIIMVGLGLRDNGKVGDREFASSQARREKERTELEKNSNCNRGYRGQIQLGPRAIDQLSKLEDKLFFRG